MGINETKRGRDDGAIIVRSHAKWRAECPRVGLFCQLCERNKDNYYRCCALNGSM